MFLSFHLDIDAEMVLFSYSQVERCVMSYEVKGLKPRVESSLCGLNNIQLPLQSYDFDFAMHPVPPPYVP